MNAEKKTVVTVVGLGYVGLPIAVEFGKHIKVFGLDISNAVVEKCNLNIDPSGEISEESMMNAKFSSYTTDPRVISESNYIIVAVPTPVDLANNPDLSPLQMASKMIGENLKKGAVVIYESTVFPGATEEVCIPILEKYSNLTWKKDFNVGYSPERINPGDKERILSKTIKVVSGDSDDTLDKVSNLYELIVDAGVYRAKSIAVAEAAKVIENAQRDINIAFMNELSIIFDRMNLNTKDVLETAGTKWNFMKFTPGLVGGHCIGVDPYYLTYKASLHGYHPEVILSGRRINEGMSKFIAEKALKMLIASNKNLQQVSVNILGVTFKENCSDLRNSKVFDLIHELQEYKLNLNIHDPKIPVGHVFDQVGISNKGDKEINGADLTIFAVAHDSFKENLNDFIRLSCKPHSIILDVKGLIQDKNLYPEHKIWQL